MKKVTGVIAIIGLGISLTWAAGQVGGWLGFQQQDAPAVEDALSGEEGISPSPGDGPPSSADTTVGAPGAGEGTPAPQPELSAEVASIEEDLARIEDALGSDEVLEEFTPSEPLSADNPVVWPTDI